MYLMLSMLEWLCAQFMEAEVSGVVGAERTYTAHPATITAVSKLKATRAK